jgi:hypothetical protein
MEGGYWREVRFVLLFAHHLIVSHIIFASPNGYLNSDRGVRSTFEALYPLVYNAGRYFCTHAASVVLHIFT